MPCRSFLPSITRPDFRNQVNVPLSLLAVTIAAEVVIHLQCRLVGGRPTDDLGGYTGYRGMWRNGLQYDTACPYLGALADTDITQYLGAGTDQYPVADFRVTVALDLAGAAQGH